ncbi:MAG TPA: aspartyl protease family protein [Blastocatellia bacterium]|nr:aspartyl protease family protein [Blastocatellia bacterium]
MISKTYRLFAVLAMILARALLASPSSAQTLVVPLNIDGPRIFVHVLVNGKHAVFLLDTGSGITLVEPRFAKGTAELKRVDIEQAAGISKASIRRLSVTLGGITIKDSIVGVLGMEGLNKELGMKLDGVLGEDILCRFRAVRINFKDKTLELEP